MNRDSRLLRIAGLRRAVIACCVTLGAVAPLPAQEATPAVETPAESAAAVPAAPVGTGVVAGKIYDEETKTPVSGARVQIAGTEITTTSGVDGSFFLNDVPAGGVPVLVAHPGYQGQRINNVVTTADTPADLNVPLKAKLATGLPPLVATDEKPTGESDEGVFVLDELEVVEADVLPNSTETFNELRRNVSISTDTFSAADFAKFSVTDLSDALVRMPGVNMAARGSFAVIRGLNERYNTTTLNGIVVPSSDPERQSVELDQFPTKLMDGIVVYKNFAADLPGNLTGGGVEVKTLAFPTKRSFSLSLGAGFDEGVFTGQDYVTYRTKGSGDRFGLGATDRVRLDSLVAFQAANPGTSSLPPDPAIPFTATGRDIPVGAKVGFSYGDRFRLGSENTLGVGFNFAYDSSFSSIEGRYNEGNTFEALVVGDRVEPVFTLSANGLPIPRAQYSYLESQEKVLIGLLGTLSLRLGDNHRVGFTAFSAQTGIDRVSQKYDWVKFGTTRETVLLDPSAELFDTSEIFSWDIRYRERNLTSWSLAGEHRLPWLGRGQLEWTAALNTAYQEEPDTKTFAALRPYNEIQYEVRTGQDVPKQGWRSWREVDEEQEAYQISYKAPFDLPWMRGASLKVGGSHSPTDRTYREMLTTFTGGGSSGVRVLDQPADFSQYVVTNLTNVGDVSLEREISAGYFTASLPLSSWLSLALGVRAERTLLRSDGFGELPTGGTGSNSILHYITGRNIDYWFPDKPWSKTNPGGPEDQALAQTRINQTDWLPAASLSISPSKSFNVRLGYSKTLARPSMREVGNYYSVDEDEQLQYGNAFLELSEIRNYDVRAEYFFSGTDLASFSVFYKEIDRPIEKFGGFSYPTSNGEDVESWFNNPDTAKVRGVEFELRKNMRWLGERFGGFTVGGNATLLDAEVAPVSRAGLQPGAVIYEKVYPDYYPTTRRLYDQPRWLLNADVTYAVESWGSSATVAFIASDKVLTAVMRDFDRYRDSTTRLDLTISQRLGNRMKVRLSAKNLMNPERKYIRDVEQTNGILIVDRRWKDGRSYSVSTSYDF